MDTSYNPAERHRSMVEEWITRRDKHFSLKLSAGVYYDDGFDCVERYLPFSQKEIECLLRHGEEVRYASETDPTATHTLFSKLWETPDGEEAKALVDRIKKDVVGVGGMEGVTEVELYELCDPFIKIYRFSILLFEDDTTSHSLQDATPINLSMSDEDYTELMIAILDDRSLSYNELAVKCPDVYSRLYEQLVDDPYHTHTEVDVKGPFILLFDEIQEDAFKIAGEPPFSGVFMAWEDTRFAYPHVLHLAKLHIVDKEVVIRDMAMPGDGACAFYQKVYYGFLDEDLMRVLGTSTCDETLKELKKRFGSRERMDQFEDFLVEAGIPFETFLTDEDAAPSEWFELEYENYIHYHYPNEALQKILDMIPKEDVKE